MARALGATAQGALRPKTTERLSATAGRVGRGLQGRFAQPRRELCDRRQQRALAHRLDALSRGGGRSSPALGAIAPATARGIAHRLARALRRHRAGSFATEDNRARQRNHWPRWSRPARALSATAQGALRPKTQSASAHQMARALRRHRAGSFATEDHKRAASRTGWQGRSAPPRRELCDRRQQQAIAHRSMRFATRTGRLKWCEPLI
jgi:hypothetical protein